MKTALAAFATSLVTGPTIAWFLWACATRRWGHAIAALILNIFLWTAGPWSMVELYKVLS